MLMPAKVMFEALQETRERNNFGNVVERISACLHKDVGCIIEKISLLENSEIMHNTRRLTDQSDLAAYFKSKGYGVEFGWFESGYPGPTHVCISWDKLSHVNQHGCLVEVGIQSN